MTPSSWLSALTTRAAGPWPTKPHPRRELLRVGGPQRGLPRRHREGLEADIGDLRLRGIIDGLTAGPTASWSSWTTRPAGPPSARYEQARLSGVHIYALLVRTRARPLPGRGAPLAPARPGRHHRDPSEQTVPRQRHAPARCGRPSAGPVNRRSSGRSRARCAASAASGRCAPPSAVCPPSWWLRDRQESWLPSGRTPLRRRRRRGPSSRCARTQPPSPVWPLAVSNLADYGCCLDGGGIRQGPTPGNPAGGPAQARHRRGSPRSH